MARNRHQSDQRADLKGSGFVGLPNVVHRSAAYKVLPLFERAVLFEIIATFNGYNNGEIVISQRQISEAIGNTNYRKIGKAIARLMEVGLVEVSAEGVWKQRQARQYRLTFISTGHPPNPRPATNEYLQYEKTGADASSAGAAISADASSARRENAADASSARPSEKWRKSVERLSRSADASSSLISKPYQGTEISSSDISADTGGDFDAHFRSQLTAFFSSKGTDAQSTLARCCGLHPSELLAATQTSGMLSAPKMAALLSEMRRLA